MGDGIVTNEDLSALISRCGAAEARVTELQEESNRMLEETRVLRRGDLRRMVREFQDKHGVPMPTRPTMPPGNGCEFRDSLIAEELNEFRIAYRNGDLVEVADALGDLLYVVEGAFQAFGIDSGPVVAEIHRSNMTKQVGERREDGKIQKGANYEPPDLGRVLVEQGWVEK